MSRGMDERVRWNEASATRWLVIINVGIFVMMSMMNPLARNEIDWKFGLSRIGLQYGMFWQLITHVFLHGNLAHIFVNMLALWFAGREVERVLGTPRFLGLYLTSGLVGGVFQVAFSPVNVPLIGASGAVFGVLLALTTMFPNVPITALVFFVLPLRMRAKYFGFGLVAVSVIFWLSGLDPRVGHLAHLGGCAAGWIFGMIYRHRAEDWFAWQSGAGPTPQRRRSEVTGARFEVMPAARDPIEHILEKVLREGIHSLTREELRILERSRLRRQRRW
jgi:membrane associated rhomboid family serine protease